MATEPRDNYDPTEEALKKKKDEPSEEAKTLQREKIIAIAAAVIILALIIYFCAKNPDKFEPGPETEQASAMVITVPVDDGDSRAKRGTTREETEEAADTQESTVSPEESAAASGEGTASGSIG